MAAGVKTISDKGIISLYSIKDDGGAKGLLKIAARFTPGSPPDENPAVREFGFIGFVDPDLMTFIRASQNKKIPGKDYGEVFFGRRVSGERMIERITSFNAAARRNPLLVVRDPAQSRSNPSLFTEASSGIVCIPLPAGHVSLEPKLGYSVYQMLPERYRAGSTVTEIYNTQAELQQEIDRLRYPVRLDKDGMLENLGTVTIDAPPASDGDITAVDIDISADTRPKTPPPVPRR